MVERDVRTLQVARVGQVRATQDATRPWVVVDGAGCRLEPVDVFLRDLLACGSSPSSCRSYAYDLLRWFRFLAAVGVSWERVARVELRDFVLWLRTADNPARARRAAGSPVAGAVNNRTGKVGLRPGYAPVTINHAVAVLSAFYDFHVQAGRGPLVSPVPPQSRAGGRVHAHHNPQALFALHRRGAYRQRQPDVEPRAVPDAVIDDLFAQLRCHRDRALFSMFLTSGARAGEVLGLTVGDVQPGDGRVWVRSKGLGGHKQACPVSPEALGWLALYLAELAADGHQPGPADPLWWTRRQPWRPLTYTALRRCSTGSTPGSGRRSRCTTCGTPCACGWSATRR